MKFFKTYLQRNHTLGHGLLVGFLFIVVLVTSVQTFQPKSLLLNEAYAFKVEGEALFVFQNVEEVNAILQAYKQRYLEHVDPNATVQSMSFLQKIEIEAIKVEGNTFDNLDQLEAYLNQTETQAETVLVLPGDSVWKIADRYQVPIESIILLNPQLNPDLIHPGDEILLEAANPLVDVSITFENTIEEVIPYPVETIRDGSMYVDERKVIEQGTDGSKLVTYRITLLNGVAQNTDILNETILQEPTQHVVRVGTKSLVMRVTGGVFKVTNGTFQSGFGYRTHPITGRKTFHAGIDISNTLGTAIYAYSAGTVTGATWEGALGNTITIDHGNGIVTRYGHLSTMNVSVGDTVVGGQHIGGMGKTGYVTGVHLHFEVLKNGVHQNPLNYLY